ncbi:response regulator transcription factor [Enterococcus sp. 669A]|uniref:Response regulator transcription factor n=1 Tax=Candidatus Enterococcus moelleringii TaxID=2815325 RepID=A0ABS3L7T4_9ENTE|nr:response regulator transcription factor [Enterococcus sp. 669A]MBO1305679.1 response regulator transcription factor [Enterococcus sp. 669A]
MAKILIVEDDPVIERELALILRNNQYDVEVVEEYAKIPLQINEAAIDLVLLDVNLKEQTTSGFTICSEIRAESDVPIIFVTSRSAVEDEIQGMMLGGDDYITKPYNISLLLLKIKALLKRAGSNDTSSELVYKGVTMSLAKSTATFAQQTVELTKNELQILHFLFLHKETIVSRGDLIDYLWNNQLYIDDNALSLHVTRLRKKLLQIGLSNFIQTKYRQGYLI